MATNAFYGADLLRIVRKYDPNNNLSRLLDPKGTNLVTMSMPHNDTDEMRVLLLCKYLNSDLPHEAVVHMRIKDFNENVQRIIDSDEVH